MRPFSTRAAGLALAALLLTVSAAAQTPVRFTVSMPRPHTHLLEVEMRFALPRPAPQVNFVMPVWAPGSYMIREFERHVQDFEAADAAGGGRALTWAKTNKNTWRVETRGAREVRVAYKVYANELSVRTNELNDRHAHWLNVGVLMYPEGHLNTPATLRVVPFGDWKVATQMAAVPGEANTFRAENFDELLDSPVEVGNFKVVSFEVSGVPHRFVIDGEGNYDVERMRRDTQKICETFVALMGELPAREYTFFTHMYTRDDGGLEHLNSSSLIMERNSFRNPAYYQYFLSLVAHEYFHLWNVKRIRPDALGPFDYSRENYTKLLWVAEGVTEYYGWHLVRRAGLLSEEDYLAKLSSVIGEMQHTPGRLKMSVEEASFDAWIKYYRRDENSVNSQISYYDKGQLVGLLLDMEIRKLSGGAKSLDDVMRHLYTEFYKKNRNYTPADFQRVAELMAGASLENFFARYVRGREELDYNAALNVVGLQLGDGSLITVARAALGADLGQEGERLVVRRVYSGRAAYEQGLNARDQIVALDGMRVNQQSFLARLAEKRPGDTINLTLFRDDDLRTLPIKLGAQVVEDFRLLPVKQPTPEQKRQYRAWIGPPVELGRTRPVRDFWK
jgi:predicted metalloprotease with PDZ domain